MICMFQSYDVPPSVPQPRELPLELNSAIENLERLETEVTRAISKILSYAGPSWREKDKLQPKLMDIKLAVLRLRSALHDLSEFSEGVLGNALKAPDKGQVFANCVFSIRQVNLLNSIVSFFIQLLLIIIFLS